MRSLAIWLLGATGAFFATAGAFLLLANFAAGPGRSGPIPQSPEGSQRVAEPSLALQFVESRLVELETAPGQAVVLYVENRGEETMREVDVALVVDSENLAGTLTHNYRTSVKDLAPDERRAVELEVDLSPPKPAEYYEPPVSGEKREDARRILEARAAAPGVEPAIQTVVLPL